MLKAALQSVGLQVETTREQNQETVDLRQVVDRGRRSRPRYSSGLRFEPAHSLEFLEEPDAEWIPSGSYRSLSSSNSNVIRYRNATNTLPSMGFSASHLPVSTAAR